MTNNEIIYLQAIRRVKQCKNGVNIWVENTGYKGGPLEINTGEANNAPRLLFNKIQEGLSKGHRYLYIVDGRMHF